VPHAVFVGVAQDVVVVATVLREIQLWLLEDGNAVGKALYLGRAEFVRVVKVREVATGQARICIDEGLDHLGDLITNVEVALNGDPVLEAGSLRDRDRRSEIIGFAVFVGDVFDEQHEQDVVLIWLTSMPPRSSSQEAQSEEWRSDFFIAMN
jgi:hypothetical protein